MLKLRFFRVRFLLLLPAACLLAWCVARAGTAPDNHRPKSWPQSRASQLVFLAVLEGLYRDGVSNDVVDAVVPPSRDGKPTFDRQHFVYACPLCHPAFEAFRLYRQRERFFGLKAPIDTFGSGLDPAISAQLRNSDETKRRQAIEQLINHWVAQRLDLMRLSPAERAEITLEMEQGRKQGMNALKSSGTETRTNCPICDGSFGACRLRPR